MVKSKRQVTNDSDRFGGYASPLTENQYTTFDSGDNGQIMRKSRDTNRLEYSRNVNRTEEFLPRVDTDANYHSSNIYTKNSNARNNEFSTTVVKSPVTIRTYKRRSNEDLMPAVKPNQEVKSATVQSNITVSSRAKVALVAYMVVALILAAAVITTGLYLSSQTLKVTSLSARANVLSASVTSQNNEIAIATNELVITGQATNMGMTKIDNKTELEHIPMETKPAIEPKTNWFDQFCDWLSGIIGD